MELTSSSDVLFLPLTQRQEETIKGLEETIKKLVKTNKTLEQITLSLQSLNKAQDETIKEQAQTILTLQSRITELEARLGLNSTNSSIPSSHDPSSSKSTSLRTKSGRKIGGQKGRKGVTRTMSLTADEVRTLTTETCSCGCSLLKIKPNKVVRRQVCDIILSPIHTIEYRSEEKTCPECSQKIGAPFPDGVENTINFGPNIVALILYLRIVLFTPYKKLVQLLDDFYDLSISPATIEKFISNASKALKPYEEEVREKLLASEMLHADETGLRVEGKLWWLHCLCTRHLTYYGIQKGRGVKAMDAIGILPFFRGILIHDFWSSYLKYQCYHAYCNAHLIRELQGIYDGFKQEWAKKTRALLEEMYQCTFGGKSEDDGENKVLKMWGLKFWQLMEKYDKVIEEGKLANPPPVQPEGKKGKPKNTKGGNLANRMEKYKYEILGFFITGGQIPFTNNEAEQAIRMMKVQQKISGTFRTEQGAIDFATIRGYISTMQKQDQSILEAVKALARGQPILLSTLDNANKMLGSCS
jgi:transposase